MTIDQRWNHEDPMARSPEILSESSEPPTTAFMPPTASVRHFSPLPSSSTYQRALNQLGWRIRLGIDGRLEIATTSKRQRDMRDRKRYRRPKGLSEFHQRLMLGVTERKQGRVREKKRNVVSDHVYSLYLGHFILFYFLYLRVKYSLCPSFSKGKVPFALLRKMVFTV